MSETFQLGPIQTAWLKSLRENGERQIIGQLGSKMGDEKYRACCLGELLLCETRVRGGDENELFVKCDSVVDLNMLRISDGEEVFEGEYYKVMGYLKNSHKRLGLRDEKGGSATPFEINSLRKTFRTLSEANDSKATWDEIADIVEANPENFFIKSV